MLRTLVVTLLLVPVAARAADTRTVPGARVAVEFRLAENEPSAETVEMPIGETAETIHVQKSAALKNVDIASAMESPSSLDKTFYDVQIAFTPAGAKKMEALSGANIGKRLAVLVDGKVLSAPTLRDKISSRAVITGRLSAEEARRIARGIVQP
jgi:preprotein translocase subunit SecD